MMHKVYRNIKISPIAPRITVSAGRTSMNAGPPDAPFEDVVGPEPGADFPDIVFLAPKANAEVQAVTRKPAIFVNALMISSVSPSLKYSSSFSALRFWKGRTAMAGTEAERPTCWSARFTSSAR